MKITLRKASALQTAIVGFLTTQQIPTTVVITQYENVNDALGKARANVDSHLESRTKLLAIQHEIRSLVGEANADNINQLLTDRAWVAKQLETTQALLKPEFVTPEADILHGKFKALTEPAIRDSRVLSYSHAPSELRVGVFSQEAFDGIAVAVGSLKRQKVGIEDALLNLNITTTIEISDGSLEFLRKLNLI